MSWPREVLVAATVFLGACVAVAQALGGESNNSDDSAKTKTGSSDGGGTLNLNPDPTKFKLGALGEVSVSGAATGYGLMQSNPFEGDRASRVDFSNLQVILQHSNGPVQVFVQAGMYSIPSLGAPNSNAIETTKVKNFGFLPLAYGTLDLGEGVTISAGQLTALSGGESTFTYQNLNIVRGLLFNQTDSISRGAQISYEKNGLTIAGSLTDGFYSGRVTYLTGAVTYAVNKDGNIAFSASTNLVPSSHETPAAPLLLNNSDVYILGYSYSAGRWTFTPFIQHTHVARNVEIGIPNSASTYGAALLGNYAFTPNLSLSARAEVNAQSGQKNLGDVSLLYGPGSKAYSFTLTPTWQKDRRFVRCEYSLVRAFDVGQGLAFGFNGMRTRQSVFAIETGVLF